jgi:TolA-binding protein
MGHVICAAAALALTLFASATPVAAQGRLDQVSWTDNAGRSKTWRGLIKENSLERTVIDAEGRDRDVDSGSVRSVAFGAVPPSYSDGVAYFDRKDFENAAAKFQVAAGDASARDVVKASARLNAAEAWVKRAGTDAAAFGEAKSQLERFLSDFPTDRETPRARLLLGRVQWLGGDAAAAVETYRGLFGRVQADQAEQGYPLNVCYEAGLLGAEASLANGDTDAARQLFNSVATALASVVAGFDPADPARHQLSDIETRARLGEGFCLLASGSVSQAKTFFQGQLSNAPKSGPQRFCARLGLAEALLADGRARDAQIEFAQVSSMDHSGRARVARALVGLAECALKLSDKNGREQAKTWLTTVQQNYGDTPSLLRAQELLKTL